MIINLTKTDLTCIMAALGLVIITDEENNPNDPNLVTECMKYILRKIVRIKK